MDDTDVKGFMIVPVRVNVAGELTKSDETSAVYVLSGKEIDALTTSVKHGDDEWVLSIDIKKKV